MTRREPPLVPRMRPYATSIFAQMSQLAAKVGAVNLGQGFPDTDGPEILKEAAIEAIRQGKGNQYPPGPGVPELRQAIAEHQQRFYGIELDPDTQVLATTGASEAIGAIILALVEPGEEVVVFEPWFDIYGAAIALAGAKRVAVPMAGPSLRPDLDALKTAVTPNTRLIILNSPHNPTGVVFTKEELEAIATIAQENDVVVMSDEVYEHLWFDDAKHIPIASLPGMFDRTLTIGSGGKTFSFTGWKVGWVTGPQDLVAATRAVRQHLSYVSGGPFQYAIATGLQLPDHFFEEFRFDLQAKRDLLCQGLESIGLDVIWPQGTYFATTDVKDLGYETGTDFCNDLPTKAGVVAIPYAPFCDHPEVGKTLVRWAFCKRNEVLEDGLTRLKRAFPQ